MDTKMTSCHYCNNQIPLSSAFTPEGVDYVYHFCGEDCFQAWQKAQTEGEKK